MSSAYLRLLIFLLAILIPAYASSSPASSIQFLMMYSVYKLNKQGDNTQPWHTLFPIWNQSVVSCPVLTITSWPAYRFLKRQVRWSGIPISFRIFHSLGTDANAKSLQSCPSLCNSIDSSPPGSPVPGIPQAITLKWVAISFSNGMKVKSKSEIAQSCLTLSDPMDCSLPGSSVHGIFQARILKWVALDFQSSLT